VKPTGAFQAAKLPLRHLIRRLKRTVLRTSPPQVDPRFAAMERVFRAPPLTESLLSAIHRISPQFDLRPTEHDRELWEADQNGACWAEYEVLRETLEGLPRDARILEIGPGLGRSLIFFSKKLGWEHCELHAYEGDGQSTKYTIDGPRFQDSWCGSISELRKVLDYNGIHGVTIHDAAKVAMTELPGPFDLVYGFYNIGFHWSLAHFMPEVLALIGQNGVAVFVVPHDFEPFEALERVPHTVIAKDSVASPKGDRLVILGPIQRASG
jgi:hypothetical protein